MNLKPFKILTVCLCAAAILSVGCAASSGNYKLAKFKTNEAGRLFVKGKTTPQDVHALLGDANDVEITNQGQKRLTYVHVRSTAKLINFVPIANSLVQGTDDTTKKLVLIFDENDKLVNYVITHSKGETKVGLLG